MNVFLHCALQEEVYVKQPHGFEDKHAPFVVCKLDNALYGHKHALGGFFFHFCSKLQALVYISSKSDTSLFIYNKSRTIIFELIYVNDII